MDRLEGEARPYTQLVLTVPTIRNVVCSIAIPPAGFPIKDFAQKLELGEVEQQIQLPQYGLWEYRDLRLQVLPDRLQLGFRESASSDLVRMASEEFAAILRDRFGVMELGFNANLRLKPEEGDGEDPTAGIFVADELATRLGGTNARGGVWLVYDDAQDGSHWWLELVPAIPEPDWWLFSVQRTFQSFPDDEAERGAVLDWFADSEAQLVAQSKTLMEG